VDQVYAHLKIRDNDALLDVGCSDGRLLEHIANRHPKTRLFGIDFAHNPLKTLAKKSIQSFPVCGDISHLPFKPTSFQQAVAIQVIQQIPTREERQHVLQNIYQTLDIDSQFICTVLNQAQWAHLVENGKEGPLITAQDLHVYLYNPHDLKEELSAAGFRVECIIGINHLPVRYMKKLKKLSIPIDRMISHLFVPFSLKRGCYLLAVCKKK